MAFRAGTFRFARKRQASCGQAEKLLQLREAGLKHRVVFCRSLVAGNLRRACAVRQRGIFLVHKRVVVCDKLGKLRRFRLEVVERVHSTQHGLERLVGLCAKRLDVECARRNSRFEAQTVARIKRFVGEIQLVYVGLRADMQYVA